MELLWGLLFLAALIAFFVMVEKIGGGQKQYQEGCLSRGLWAVLFVLAILVTVVCFVVLGEENNFLKVAPEAENIVFILGILPLPLVWIARRWYKKKFVRQPESGTLAAEDSASEEANDTP